MRHQFANNAYLSRYRRDPNSFGGDLLNGNPKFRRPFAHHKALHVTMRAEVARGRLSMIEPRVYKPILAIVQRQALKFGVSVYHFANSGNHLHLLVRPPRKRAQFANFLRAISGLIARLVLRAERGAAKGIKFWNRRPFSRVVNWGKAFRDCYRYVGRNILETMGFEAVEEVHTELKRWARYSFP